MNKPISENTLMLFYRPDCSKARKALAYARSITTNIMEIDLDHSAATSTIWRQLFTRLGKSPKELLNKSLPEYQQNYRGREMSEDDWINVIRHNTFLLRSPIALRGSRGFVLDNPTDIYKLQ
jgi:arsenate reductase-like glutaredoxin family protein